MLFIFFQNKNTSFQRMYYTMLGIISKKSIGIILKKV